MPGDAVRHASVRTIRCDQCGRDVHGWWDRPDGRKFCETCMRAENATGVVAELLTLKAALLARAERAEAERDAARDELLEKWELYQAVNGAEVYHVIEPKIRKLYMQLNAKARGDDTDFEGDPVQQWNRLVDLAVTAVVRWIAANRWAVNEHQRVEQVEAERDALQAMVDCCRELVPELTGEAQDGLAAIVGWPGGIATSQEET